MLTKHINVNGLVSCVGGLTIVALIGCPLLLFTSTIYNRSQYLEEYCTIAPKTFAGFRFAYQTGNWYTWYCFITVIALAVISILSIIPGVPFIGFCVTIPIQSLVFVFQIMIVILLIFGLQENYYVSATTINEDELTDIEHSYECCIPEYEFYKIGNGRVCSSNFTMNCNDELLEHARKCTKTIGFNMFLSLFFLFMLNLYTLVSLRHYKVTHDFFQQFNNANLRSCIDTFPHSKIEKKQHINRIQSIY
ncbi:hypothetical protein QTN25_010389 [Entamoeba marina]